MQFHEPVSTFLSSEVRIRILRFLLEHEASMSEREIAAVLGVSHMSVNRIMKELAEMNLVHYARVGKAHLWKVNRNSLMFLALAPLVESLNDAFDPLSVLQNTILRHLPRPLIQRMTLFGSIAQGKERPDSDIDLFILVKNIKDRQALEKPLEKLSLKCLELFGNRLAPYVLTEKQLKDKRNLDIISEIDQGLQLYPDGKGKT